MSLGTEIVFKHIVAQFWEKSDDLNPKLLQIVCLVVVQIIIIQIHWSLIENQ